MIVAFLFLALAAWFIWLVYKYNRAQPYYGYVLKDGRKIFYVGQTKNPRRRYAQHIRNAKRNGTHKERYIFDMLRKGKRPTIQRKKKTYSKEAINEWERKHIKKWGLTNTVGR